MTSNAYLWFVGMSFAQSDFVETIDEMGVQQVYETYCPHKDITPELMDHLRAAFECEELRDVNQQWWEVYNTEAVRIQLPTMSSPWMPLKVQ